LDWIGLGWIGLDWIGLGWNRFGADLPRVNKRSKKGVLETLWLTCAHKKSASFFKTSAST